MGTQPQPPLRQRRMALGPYIVSCDGQSVRPPHDRPPRLIALHTTLSLLVKLDPSCEAMDALHLYDAHLRA
jgi:hypothetical protein